MPGRAAAELPLGGLEQLQARDAAQQLARLQADASGRGRGGRRRGRRRAARSACARPAAPRDGEQLVHVDDLGGELARAVGVEDVPVVLHHRAAAGDVGDDLVVALVGRDRRLGERDAPPPRRPRASAARRSSAASAGEWTSQPSALSTRTVAALTSPKNTRWMQPCMNATVPRLAGAFDVVTFGERPVGRPSAGASEQHRLQPLARHQRRELGRELRARRQRAQPRRDG